MALELVKGLVRSQFLTTLPVPTTSCEGKTVIVTGANIGLGFEAAKHFTKLNATKVIIACRSLEKGEAAKKAIEEETKRKDVLEVWQLDLSSYASVKAFAARANGLERVDILLENAGVSTREYTLAEDNESTITVNVVSTFLLALLMLPKLKETATKFGIHPNLTIVSSGIHVLSNLPERNDKSGRIFDTLNDKSKAKMADRYPLSKLLEVFVVREMVERHAKEDYPVTINYVDPGFCRSALMREMTVVSKVMYIGMNARTTEQGSRTLVHAAMSGPETHGQYMSDCHIAQTSAFVRSAEGKKASVRVWEELSEKLEKIEPGVLKNI